MENTAVHHYDVIIAGGGLSGLCFLIEAIKSPAFTEKKILLIDAERRNDDDRTWSFWSTESHQIPDLAVKRWSKGRMIDQAGVEIDFDFAPYQYHTVFASDFYNYAYRQVEGKSNVVFHYDKILSCDASRQLVVCERSRFSAPLIIRSFYDKDELQLPKAPVWASVWQHFEGWFIETDKECFDDTRVLLMDYRVASSDFTQFFYILPFSATSALVEYTEFSNRDFDAVDAGAFIKDYVQSNLRLDSYRVVRKERSSIPMTDKLFRQMNGKNIINIGTLAGYVKPSSGYCFSRTFKKVKQLVQRLEAGTVTPEQLSGGLNFWFYDSLLLQGMSSGKLSGQLLFPQLLQRLKQRRRPTLIFKFLDEDTSFLENMQIVLAMPYKHRLVNILLKTVFTGSLFQKISRK